MPYAVQDDLRSRVRQAVERRLRRVPYVERYLALEHRLARADHVDKLPWLEPPLRALHRQLSETGLAQTHLSELGLPVEATLRAADALVAALRQRPVRAGAQCELVDDDTLLAHPEPFLFGLSGLLLDLAERYLGLPVDYLGVNVKRELANGLSIGTRQWHADPEDERMLKLIVYLSDVGEDSGPFAALDARDSAEARRVLRYGWGGHCTSEALERVVPPARWKRCTGPRLTAVFADTARCLHRASPPTGRDRYSMTFSYLSRRAYFCFADGRALQQRFLARYGGALDARQRSALAPA